MKCRICGKQNCTESFHSIKEQEDIEKIQSDRAVDLLAENKKLKIELAHEIDMNAQGRAKMDIDDVIDNFISELDFDHVIAWANLLGVEVNYPPIDDMYPDWENELAVEVGDAMRKVGKKS